MKLEFRNGQLLTPTHITDALHNEMSDGGIPDIERYVRMRWHAESQERDIERLQHEIKTLETRIQKLEPPYL